MPTQSSAKAKSNASVQTSNIGDVVGEAAIQPASRSQSRSQSKLARKDLQPRSTRAAADPTSNGDAGGRTTHVSLEAIAPRRRQRATNPTAAEAPGAASDTSAKVEPPAASAPSLSKAQRVLTLLRGDGGATLLELQAATGWQAHSVRGFLSGTVKKRMGLALTLQPDDAGARRYALANG